MAFDLLSAEPSVVKTDVAATLVELLTDNYGMKGQLTSAVAHVDQAIKISSGARKKFENAGLLTAKKQSIGDRLKDAFRL
jgi:hypothetical protein